MIIREKREYPKQTGHVKKSVVVEISGKTLIIRKNMNIQKKTEHLTNSVVAGISGQTLKNRPNVNSQKKSLANFGGSRNFRPNVKKSAKR